MTAVRVKLECSGAREARGQDRAHDITDVELEVDAATVDGGRRGRKEVCVGVRGRERLASSAAVGGENIVKKGSRSACREGDREGNRKQGRERTESSGSEKQSDVRERGDITSGGLAVGERRTTRTAIENERSTRAGVRPRAAQEQGERAQGPTEPRGAQGETEDDGKARRATAEARKTEEERARSRNGTRRAVRKKGRSKGGHQYGTVKETAAYEEVGRKKRNSRAERGREAKRDLMRKGWARGYTRDHRSAAGGRGESKGQREGEGRQGTRQNHTCGRLRRDEVESGKTRARTSSRKKESYRGDNAKVEQAAGGTGARNREKGDEEAGSEKERETREGSQRETGSAAVVRATRARRRPEERRKGRSSAGAKSMQPGAAQAAGTDEIEGDSQRGRVSTKEKKSGWRVPKEQRSQRASESRRREELSTRREKEKSAGKLPWARWVRRRTGEQGTGRRRHERKGGEHTARRPPGTPSGQRVKQGNGAVARDESSRKKPQDRRASEREQGAPADRPEAGQQRRQRRWDSKRSKQSVGSKDRFYRGRERGERSERK
ncbi:hypothetical protein Tco_1244309 [Tanacetum coccineum]